MNHTARTISKVVLEGSAPSPQQTSVSGGSSTGFERGSRIYHLLADSIPTLVCCGDGAPPSSTTLTRITDFLFSVRSNQEKSGQDRVSAEAFAKEETRPSRLRIEANRFGAAQLRRSEGGFSLVEVSIALFLLITIAVFGLKTMTSAWMLQNWSIMQNMTDAYAGIETAFAQRVPFASIESGRWPVYPASASTVVTIGVTPRKALTATVVRTRIASTLDPVTGAQSYLLESYVNYQDSLRQYCKVSKVYRDQ
jgi:hypothetical protein